ncbi:hypothetical protein H5410_036226 [Solanum commersonii]|uniref:Uncharacterized protein n=1 Tax=Solanum commersonii TaxID=4109 RepID=A0A9J5Y4S5_SOLCO|nr:hypothetical protein H5410_036226 [Solanum commersonii]
MGETGPTRRRARGGSDIERAASRILAPLGVSGEPGSAVRSRGRPTQRYRRGLPRFVVASGVRFGLCIDLEVGLCLCIEADLRFMALTTRPVT